uniref:Integrase catalytic domain-containing protein n=1 Tax=Vitis vinifera TaxID=29760 RepID=A5BBZ6_VITVI|nr:hypothetical protein VITISV_013672 [Vitis vinifera]
MTLELNIFYMSKRSINPEEKEGPKEVCIIDTLVEEHCNQKIQEKLNERLPKPSDFLATLPEEAQEAVKEEPPKLNMKPLPTELKYTYLEENKKCPVVISSSLTTPQEEGLLEVLKRYSPWVNLTQVVPKKSGITVVQNEKGEEVATRLTSGWRVCIDYRKLNVVTMKDHFPLPFIDQVLERVSGHPFYYFLDGYSEYFQIEIDVEDQEKTTFTCPFGTFAYRRMSFGLCNAPATFQRCMLSIFNDMVECIMEVFMNDITIYGRIVLGHIISNKGIEVDKAKVELIIKLPSPTTVKGVRQFLGHVGFYRRFIKDFSKLSKPLCELLGKDVKFVWDERCQKSFEQLKQFLTTAPTFFALDKFRAYLIGSFIVVFTYHSALKYLLTKQDVKERLIRWILLLQEFNLQIKDKKRVENVVANHLSRLAIAHNSHVLPINDDFPEESLMLLEDAPWYAHIANYLVTGEVPTTGNPQSLPRKRMWRPLCLSENSHEGVAIRFQLAITFQRCSHLCRSYDRCQRLGKLTRRNQMPMNPILIVDLFDVWGIDFMRPFPMSFGNSYILVGVDYVSKWVEAIPCKHNDHRVFLKFLKENIFSRFGVPKAIISDGGTHFCNKPFETFLAKYGLKHKVATPYHPPTFEIAYKTILSMSPYRLVYGKACHLPMEVEYKAWWAIKKLNMDLNRAGMKRCLDLNEMEELRNDAYINFKIAKQRMKRLHIFLGKLKSRWIGPFIIHQVHFNGVVELLNSNSTDTFKVNGHRLKPFMKPFNQDKEEPTKHLLGTRVPFRKFKIQFRNCEPTCEILKAKFRKSTFQLAKHLLGTCVPFRNFKIKFRSCESTCEPTCENTNPTPSCEAQKFQRIPSIGRPEVVRLKRTTPRTSAYPMDTSLSISAMAKMRRAQVASPSARNTRPRASPARDSMSEAPQASAIPPFEGGVQPSPPQRKYETRRPPTTPGASNSRPKKSNYRPPIKRTRVLGPGESSAPPQPQPPTTESQIPSGMTPEGIIRCLGIEFQSQKSGVKSKELVVERSLKLDALNLNWLGVIDGPPLHGQFRKEYL